MLVDQVHNLHDMSVQTLLKAVAEIGYALFEPRHRVQIKKQSSSLTTAGIEQFCKHECAMACTCRPLTFS
jgi:archaeosine-15-forming tRNA-guanine transglycosylase